MKDKSLVASLRAYSVIAFCGSFCGRDVLLVDLFSLTKYIEENLKCGENEYVILSLMGQFKNELRDQYWHVVQPLQIST
jgi:hypothetical protein